MLSRSWLNRAGLFPYELVYRYALNGLKGKDIRPFLGDADLFYRDELKPMLAPGIISRLRQHQADGHLTVIISGQIRQVLEPMTGDLGLDAVIGTELEVGPDGLMTGRPRGTMCIGDAKVALAQRLAAEHGVDLGRSYAYTDHYTDLPLLEIVGNPVAVAPEKQLLAESRRRGWPVLGYY
jgi:HAD superfamily hydrolase (TIGR01490 family)